MSTDLELKHGLVVLPGINHSFIGKTPEQTRDANLKALDATFRHIQHFVWSENGANFQERGTYIAEPTLVTRTDASA